jgi:hypothetical protein
MAERRGVVDMGDDLRAEFAPLVLALQDAVSRSGSLTAPAVIALSARLDRMVVRSMRHARPPLDRRRPRRPEPAGPRSEPQ